MYFSTVSGLSEKNPLQIFKFPKRYMSKLLLHVKGIIIKTLYFTGAAGLQNFFLANLKIEKSIQGFVAAYRACASNCMQHSLSRQVPYSANGFMRYEDKKRKYLS